MPRRRQCDNATMEKLDETTEASGVQRVTLNVTVTEELRLQVVTRTGSELRGVNSSRRYSLRTGISTQELN